MKINRWMLREKMTSALPFLAAVVSGFLVSGLLAWSLGENPLHMYGSLLTGGFGSRESFGFTLYYATTLIFTGLAVAIPYRLGLFNIGGEGQLLIAAAGLWAGLRASESLPPLAQILVGCLCAALAGGAWALIAIGLKLWRHTHEVISTIMLNFIAAAMLNYWILYCWKDPDSQGPQTSTLSETLHFWHWSWPSDFYDTPVNFTLVIAIAALIAVGYFFERTRTGLDWKLAGHNPVAARFAGISIGRAQLWAMVLAGALSAGVGLNEILGNSHRLKDGFSPGYGFTGIAVAFIGRHRPLGIFLAAIFLGGLARGSLELELESKILTRDFSNVLQATLIAAVCLLPFWKTLIKARKSRGKNS